MMADPADRNDGPAVPRRSGMCWTRDGVRDAAEWALAEEAVATVLVNSERFGIMMLTPDHLDDFALGFTLNEGIVSKAGDLTDVRIEAGRDGPLLHLVTQARVSAAPRIMAAGSACGVCGALAFSPPRQGAGPSRRPPGPVALDRALNGLAEHQPKGEKNRSMHVAAWADETGMIIAAREDVGRHVALDKLAGAIAQNAVPGFVVLSSRVSTEMVHKAQRMGAAAIAAISAPTDLALDCAAKAELTVASRSGDGLMIFAPGARP